MRRRLGAIAFTLTLCAHVFILSGGSGWAAFPGVNGKIVFNGANGHLFTIDPDGTDRTDLGAVGARPAWTPDGRRIAFDRQDLPPEPGIEGGDTVELFTVDADGSNEVQLTRSGGLKGSASWSPDGKQIAYDYGCEGCYPERQIRVVNADGTNDHALTESDSSAPAWSPNGDQIAFVGSDLDELGFVSLHVVNSDGTCPKSFRGRMPIKGNPQSPHWSPDGTEIVFAFGSFSAPSNRNDLYAIGRDGSGLRRLTNTPASVESRPAWSPDGTSIVFDRYQTPGLFVIDSQGGNERTLTSEPGFDADWQRLPLGTTGPPGDVQHGPVSRPLHDLSAEVPEPDLLVALPVPLGGRQGVLSTVACTVLEPIGL